MPTLEEVRSQFEALDRGEQEELFASLAGRLRTVLPDPNFPLIVSTPDVCGGDLRIVRTRVPVWSIERMRQLGGTAPVILENYPSLRAVHLTQAWAYAEAHRDEVEQAIRENEEE